MDVDIRVERPQDAPAIAALLRDAFPGEPVDVLVEELRAGPGYRPDLALVATDPGCSDGGEVIGFVMLTALGLEPEPYRPGSANTQILCLSPLAVAAAARGHGVGGGLVRAALARAGGRVEPYVVLEGSPRYYGRLGFVDATRFGLRSPSQRIPPGAFQAVALHAGVAPRGRVLYPRPFWEVVTPGLPFEGVPWLDELERHCRALEAVVTPDALGVAVPACPGWTVGEVLSHLGVIHRLVEAWLREGRRPRPDEVVVPASGVDLRAWFATGWRALHARLAALDPDAAVPTWCPWDATAGFWQRRQAHEHAIHALDVAEALDTPWSVDDAVAVDGVEEVVRLWLGTQLGSDVGGRGDAVRLVAGQDSWTVVLHAHVAELHRLPVAVNLAPEGRDAQVSADPVTLYRWLWGRACDDAVRVEGDPAAVAVLRRALARALQ